MRFAGKLALVTGAGSGIGRATAVRLAAEGARVVAVGRRPEALARTAEIAGTGVETLELDLLDVAATEEAVVDRFAKLGHLDLCVHAAGLTIPGAAHELSGEQWDLQMAANVKTIHTLNRLVWPLMERAKAAAIVNVASTASLAAFPADAAYCASKGAVLSMTKAMALDGAPVDIRVNAVCPGFIDTEMLQGYFDDQPDPAAARQGAEASSPIPRLGRPDEVAATIAFLLSADASYITGASLLIDGGVLAKVV